MTRKLPLMAGLAICIAACNQEFSKVIPEGDPVDSVNVAFGSPRVLYIIADGARGKSVHEAETPAITALLPNAIYSWESLSDEESAALNGANWADMLTGVQQDKHGVVGNDFSNERLDDFPLLFERIQAAMPNSNVQAYTSAPLFYEQLTTGADDRALLDNDGAVKDAAAAALAAEDITIVTAHFTGIDQAGSQYGYDLSVPQYREAIFGFDQYVGELMETLRARPNYSQENWLVVITSSRGGQYTVPDDENDNTIFSNPEVNTFTIFHSPRYRTRVVSKPFLGIRFQGDFVRFQQQLRGEVTAGDNDLYNLEDEAFTIELKVKKNPGPNNNYQYTYPALINKRERWTWDYVGWTIFLENDFWMFNARGLGNNVGQTRGGTLANATWNSIAVVGVIRDNRRFVRTFTNGQFNNETEITNYGSITNNIPLMIGGQSDNGQADCYIADVRFWKVALPDDVVRQYSCETGIAEDHPYYDFLVGLWPVVGSADNTITDEGPLGSHMTLGGAGITRQYQSDYVCAPSSSDLGALVPRNVDIPAQIVSWLKIPRQESWQLDGRVWLDR
ncbi:alkaline phosphatase family protein [Parapedobacter pyrenivorans]|nr:alkaline phosphatase family protein [Parapedobacter pyrenivorans]